MAAGAQGLDGETVRAIAQGAVTICAILVGATASYIAATKSSATVSRTEREKREHADAGRRRKLRLLLKRASRTMAQNISAVTVRPKSWATLVNDLREYIMTVELASAIRDETQMLAVYDILDALEEAHATATSVAAEAQDYYDEVDERNRDADEDDYWTNDIKAKICKAFVGPTEALRYYWFLVGENTLGADMSESLARAALFAEETRPPLPSPFS